MYKCLVFIVSYDLRDIEVAVYDANTYLSSDGSATLWETPVGRQPFHGGETPVAVARLWTSVRLKEVYCCLPGT